MPTRALTVAEVAAELGRSEGWLHEHWRRLVTQEKMPAPIHQAGALAWSAPGFYAWLDRNLSPPMRAAAAAYRAALEAASDPANRVTSDAVAEARARLDARFGKPEAA